LNLVLLVAGGNIFWKDQEVGKALVEAFDHADVSLIDLLGSDGDAAPIGAGVEEIERLLHPVVKFGVGGSAAQTPASLSSRQRMPFKSGLLSGSRYCLNVPKRSGRPSPGITGAPGS
jgi:hypothetical protein